MKKKLTKLSTRRNNPSSDYWKNKASAAWGAAIHGLYDGCPLDGYDERDPCGESGRLEAHHIIGKKGHKSTVHSFENGILLCSKHHKFSCIRSPHNSPAAFDVWLEEHRPEQWKWVKEHVNIIHYGKVDYKARAEVLQEILEKGEL